MDWKYEDLFTKLYILESSNKEAAKKNNNNIWMCFSEREYSEL